MNRATTAAAQTSQVHMLPHGGIKSCVREHFSASIACCREYPLISTQFPMSSASTDASYYLSPSGNLKINYFRLYFYSQYVEQVSITS